MTGVRVSPERKLFRQGLVAVFAFMVPVFVVLYLLTASTGLGIVVGTQIFFVIVGVIASILFFRAGIWIEDDGLREVGFFGRTHRVASGEIGSIVHAKVFTGNSSESSPQLFVCDFDGKQVLRMRGQFWSPASIQAVIDSAPVPITRLDTTVSKSELRQEYPGLLYGFERHPIVAALVFAAATATVGFGVLLLLRAFRVLP